MSIEPLFLTEWERLDYEREQRGEPPLGPAGTGLAPAEIDRLRAELANARLERDNIASLNSSLIAKDGIIANLNERSAQYERDSVAKDARIAELEAYHTNCTDYINGLLGNMADDDKERVAILARAERAEAERDAMRSLLVDTLPDLEAAANIHRGDSLLKRVRAALNPSPAGEKT